MLVTSVLYAPQHPLIPEVNVHLAVRKFSQLDSGEKGVKRLVN